MAARQSPNTLARRAAAGLALMGLMAWGAIAPAQAQNAQMNALYDKIMQLERKVDAMQPGAAAGGGGAPSGGVERRLDSIEQQLRTLMNEMRNLDTRMRALEARRSGDAGTGGASHAGTPSSAPEYGADGLATGSAGGMGGPLELDKAPGAQVLATIPQSAMEQEGSNLGYVPPENGRPATAGQGTVSGSGPMVLGDAASGTSNSGYSGSGYTGSADNGSAYNGSAYGGSTYNGSGGTGSGASAPAASGMGVSALPEPVETASLDNASTAGTGPDALYERSYENLLQRQYGAAENGFRTFLGQYGSNELAGNAQYWLGETFYARGDYKQAAEAFLKGYRNYAKSPKAPDSLFKLGLTLKQLGQTKQACATLAQVGKAYPKATKVVEQAKQESTQAGC